MKKILDAYGNLINGNLKEAKHMVEEIGFARVYNTLLQSGVEHFEAWPATAFLKGKCTFQDYCDNTAKALESEKVAS